MATANPDSAVKPLPYKLPISVRKSAVVNAAHPYFIMDAAGLPISSSSSPSQAAALVAAANAQPAHERCREALQQIALLADSMLPMMGRFEAARPLADEILAKARAALAVEVGGGK